MRYSAVELFSGCGGLTEGLKKAGFDVKVAVEIDRDAAEVYKINHPETHLLRDDIRNIDPNDIKKLIGDGVLHLLAGCPPCQGFSSVRRLNKKNPVEDDRNSLIWEYYRMVEALKPLTIMLENVSGLTEFNDFHVMIEKLMTLGYTSLEYKTVWIQRYGVPQRRKRLVMIGSRIGEINIPNGTNIERTVRDYIGNLPSPEKSMDSLHKIYPKHTESVQNKINLIPKDGGSRSDLPFEMQLSCHRKKNIGFHDIYGRLKWDAVSSTITGGCLNPSKGRFLHPEENRCISAREAALLQTFPINYQFPIHIPRQKLALMIGNALPPLFSFEQSKNIINHLKKYCHE